MIIVRFAGDIVLGFQYEHEARACWQDTEPGSRVDPIGGCALPDYHGDTSAGDDDPGGGAQDTLTEAVKVEQTRRLKDLEQENARIKRAVAELTLDELILTRILADQAYPGPKLHQR